MTLDEKIELVKNDLFSKHPNVHYTIKILLWDDGTDLVECRYGDMENIYTSTYYDNRLTYKVEEMMSCIYLNNKFGKDIYVMSEEMFNEQFLI